MKRVEKIKMSWNRNKPIIMCIIFSVLETILFFIMGHISTSDNYSSIRTYQTYFGDYIVGIATTWYVIFTYFILKANVDIRNSQITPSFQISWNQNNSLDTNKMSDYDYLSKYCKNFVTHSNIGDEDRRYIKLNIQNTKSSVLDSLSIKLRIDCLANENEVIGEANKILNLHICNINISQDKNLIITVLDLAHVPDHFKIKLAFASFVCKLKNSKEQITEDLKDQDYETMGIYKFEEPVPQQDK